MKPPVPRWSRPVTMSFWLVVALLLFAKAMSDGMNHDEHQFVAPAALIGKAMPYRDFPLFHLPNLTLIYAGLSGLFGHPFLCARIFNALCATVAVGLVFRQARRRFGDAPPVLALALAAAAAAILLFSPLFIETSGKAWNHDLPMLLTVAAFLLHVAAAENRAPMLVLAGSGLCIGFAIGTRLTYAPMAAPFLLGCFLLPFSRRRQLALAGIFCAGVVAGLLPVLWYFAQAPEQFWFGNFEFPRLRLVDPTDERAQKTMKLWRKVRFLAKEIAPVNPAIFLLFAAGLPGLWRGLRRGDFESRFHLLALPFVLAGCLAPTRYQAQHYYLLAPFFVLAGVHGVAAYRARRTVAVALLLAAAGTLAFGVRDYAGIGKLRPVAGWVPMRAHAAGLEAARAAQGRKIMTLAPIFAVEAGAEIYPEFATGPFAVRLAHLVPPGRRRKMHLVAREEIGGFLEADPPGAILTGFEPRELEDPLRDYARANGFQRAPFRKNQQLWSPGVRRVAP